MNIDWGSLGLVAVTTVVATVAVVGIFSLGVVSLSSGTRQGGEQVAGPTPAAKAAGYACVAVAGLLVLYGLWLIVPQFH